MGDARGGDAQAGPNQTNTGSPTSKSSNLKQKRSQITQLDGINSSPFCSRTCRRTEKVAINRHILPVSRVFFSIKFGQSLIICSQLDYMWTEPTTKLAPTVSQSTGMDFFASFDFAVDEVPGSHLRGASKADAPNCNVPFMSPGQLEMVNGVEACLLPAPEAPAIFSDILDLNYLWESRINGPGSAGGDALRPAEISTADKSQLSGAYTTNSATNSTLSTDLMSPGNSYCSCTSVGTCSHCRLKQRVARLEAESESLRATLRATIEKARSIVSKHDGVLQDVHDSRRAPASVMEELWRYQEELRKVLSSCRE